MKCKTCGTPLTANTLRDCPKCAADKAERRKKVPTRGLINRVFELAALPMNLGAKAELWNSDSSGLLAGLAVATTVMLTVIWSLFLVAMVLIYVFAILPFVLAFRWCVRIAR